jgi:hypothetical protein
MIGWEAWLRIDRAELAWSCASVGLGKTAHRQPPEILIPVNVSIELPMLYAVLDL